MCNNVLLQDIGAVFLDVCVRENEVWVLAECLDCIYDVFGSDDHNSVLKELRLVEKLKELLPVYKQKVTLLCIAATLH